MYHPHPHLPYGFAAAIAALPFVERVILFGSRARGDHRPRSDIDLAVSCPGATPQQWFQVVDIVDEADTLLEIDCVRLDEMAPADRLRQRIEQEGIVLFDRGKE